VKKKRNFRENIKKNQRAVLAADSVYMTLSREEKKEKMHSIKLSKRTFISFLL